MYEFIFAIQKNLKTLSQCHLRPFLNDSALVISPYICPSVISKGSKKVEKQVQKVSIHQAGRIYGVRHHLFGHDLQVLWLL
jgi:hypothetical protein